jgi:hypothetical protein
MEALTYNRHWKHDYSDILSGIMFWMKRLTEIQRVELPYCIAAAKHYYPQEYKRAEKLMLLI